MPAVPKVTIAEAVPHSAADEGMVDVVGARALLAHVQTRLAEMSVELADARSDARHAKSEVEGFQIQARAGVLADYTRNRVAAERWSWIARFLRPFQS